MNYCRTKKIFFRHVVLLIIVLSSGAKDVYAQENVLTFGIQFKPIFSSRFFGTGPIEEIQGDVSYRLTPAYGYSGGMMIRKGYSKRISFETGINFVRRDFKINIQEREFSLDDKFRIIGYEIPFSTLVFIQLGEYMYMNASLGLCVNMFPSDVSSNNSDYIQYSGRYNIFNPSLLSNIGFEYRTRSSGYFYFGVSLNRPFTPIYLTAIDYLRNQNTSIFRTPLRGSYLTLDFRYFFHEDPKKTVKKKKDF
jgi:hypothetical protein